MLTQHAHVMLALLVLLLARAAQRSERLVPGGLPIGMIIQEFWYPGFNARMPGLAALQHCNIAAFLAISPHQYPT